MEELVNNTNNKKIKININNILRIIKTIPATDLNPVPKNNILTHYPAWRTLCYAGYYAKIYGVWKNPWNATSESAFLPHDFDIDGFCKKWDETRNKDSVTLSSLLNLVWPIQSPELQVVAKNAGSDTTCSRYNQYVNQKIIRNISVNISKTLGLEAIYPVRKMTFILNT